LKETGEWEWGVMLVLGLLAAVVPLVTAAGMHDSKVIFRNVYFT
jgi:hypothetical protein